MSEEKSNACCPPDAIGPVPPSKIDDNDDKCTKKVVIWKPKEGSTRTELNCFQFTSASSASDDVVPERIVLVYPDVYGAESGRHEDFCRDLLMKLGADNKTAVWMPDLFRGNPIGTDIVGSCRTRCGEDYVMADLMDIIIYNLPSKAKVVAIGFCYGGWVVARHLGLQLASDNKHVVVAGMGIHPSWKIELIVKTKTDEEFKAVDDQKLYSNLATSCGNIPLLFCPASSDVVHKLDSPIIQQLCQQQENDCTPNDMVVEFNDEKHGFVPRGDPSNPSTKEAQDKVLQLTTDFIQKHAPL